MYSEKICETQALQNRILALDKEIADAKTNLRFAEAGERFAVAIQPKMSTSAYQALKRVHEDGERCRQLVQRLREQRRRLVAEFERRKRRDCGGCSRCIVNV